MANIECICPARPDGEPRHPDGDTVTIRQTVDFTAALTIRNIITLLAGQPGMDDADILAHLTEKYLYLGIEEWTLVDARGKPIPVTRAAIAEHLLSRPMVAMVVGEEADELYTAAVVLPLLDRASTSSPATPSTGSTSARTASPTPLPRRSRPSSTSTSQTDGIATISASPAGGSSFSQS